MGSAVDKCISLTSLPTSSKTAYTTAWNREELNCPSYRLLSDNNIFVLQQTHLTMHKKYCIKSQTEAEQLMQQLMRCFKNISLQMHQIMVFIRFASRFKGLTRCSKSSGIAIYSRRCWDSIAIPIFWTKQRPGLVKGKYSRASSTWSFRMRGWLWSPA